MPNTYFRFKQFTIQQDRTAMKVGTDGVLLGSWACVNNPGKILDIGTGTGLTAIMMAQRSDAQIFAIEPEENAFSQALDNTNHCPWPDRIHIEKLTLQKYALQCQQQFDLIISNPPYFSDSLTPLDQARTQARHTNTLSFLDLLDGTIKLLYRNGRLCLILPYTEGLSFINMAEHKGFFCNKKTFVKTKPHKKPKRMLMEFSFYKTIPLANNLILEKEKRHQFTRDYIDLTKAFYPVLTHE